LGRGGAGGGSRVDAQRQGFGENAELVSVGDGLEGVGDRVDEGCKVREGKIVDNLADVVERPSHNASDRRYFEGRAVGGEFPAEELIPKLNCR